MDKSRGYPATSTMDFSPESPESDMRGDFRGEGLGAPMRRLEADMGLPIGYLAIRERPSRQQYSSPERQDRPAPAPYYPEEQPRPNPRPGTIPIMPGNNSYDDQRYQQRYVDPRYQQEQYVDPRYVQPYLNPRNQNYDRRYQQEQYIDRNQQMLLDERYQDPYNRPSYLDPNQYYRSQRSYDPRIQGNRPYLDGRYRQQYYDSGYQDGRSYDRRYEDGRYYDRRYQDGRYYDPRYQDGRSYDSRYQDGRYYDPRYQDRYYDRRYQPGDYYKDQWWEQSQYPVNPNQRYIPGRNPELNQYREQWWRQANTPPGSYDSRIPSQQPYDQIPYQDQYRYDQSQNFTVALQSLIGRSVPEFDRTVPARLGCARAVSLALERAYGVPTRAQGCAALEREIQQYGWVQVDPKQIQPGDVIVAHRQPGDYGHAAIFVGNNLVYNNNSNSGRIQLDNVSKFRSREFVRVNVYRKMR